MGGCVGQLVEQIILLPHQVEVLISHFLLSGHTAEASYGCFALLAKWHRELLVV